jgi:serine/threonine protein kinase
VPLLDYWRDPDGAYLVHPLLHGGDLRHRMARQPITRDDCLGILEPIAAALDHAHQRGVLHGRLHPGNVLFDDEDNLYVSDLGLAQMATGSAPATLDAYTAPEAVGGGAVTIAGDVFALGVLAFELLEGRPPPQDRGLPLPSGALGDLLARATSSAVDDRPDDVPAFITELREVVTGAQQAGPVRTSIRNPYRGLEPFLEADAGDFHGRDALVTELVDILAANTLVAVVGPSGIGKSSVVRAGLIPTLRQGAIEGSDRWLITELVPGDHPFEELAAALRRIAVDTTVDVTHELRDSEQGLVRCAPLILPPDGHLLLLIDQFEELFTQTLDAEARRRFLDLLVATASDPQARVRVVVTLRADFLDRPLRFPAFAEVMRRATVLVRGPDRDELSSSIREPATRLGVQVEERLVERIVADADGQPGALPLVQRVLYDLFTGRKTDRLTVAAYEAEGGLRGAIGRKVEQLYLGLPAGHRRRRRRGLSMSGEDE